MKSVDTEFACVCPFEQSENLIIFIEVVLGSNFACQVICHSTLTSPLLTSLILYLTNKHFICFKCKHPPHILYHLSAPQPHMFFISN